MASKAKSRDLVGVRQQGLLLSPAVHQTLGVGDPRDSALGDAHTVFRPHLLGHSSE